MNQELTAKRDVGFLVASLIGAIALIGLLLPNVPAPRLALVTPVAYFVAVLGDIGTAIVLMATWGTSYSRRATLTLVLTFAFSAVLLLIAMMTLPIMPLEPPVLSLPPQSALWILTLWHLFVAAGVAAYVFQRFSDRAVVPSWRFIFFVSATACGATISIVAFALLAGPHVPLGNGASLFGLSTTGVGPFVVLTLAGATILAFCLRDPTPIDRALGFSSAALTVEMALFILGTHRYTPTFYAGRVLLVLGEIFVFIAAIRTLIFSRSRLQEIEGSLAREVSERTRQAKRIRAVWEIASHVDTGKSENFEAILSIATAAMRPGMPMFGSLSHLEDDVLVFDATAWSGDDQHSLALSAGVFPGARVPFERSMQSLLGTDGRTTLAWNDLNILKGRGMLFEELALRSCLGTPVLIGRQTYFVTFSSSQTTGQIPFAEDDIAFVDVIAAFFAHRFTQQKQFERIQFQIEHDALTGLENRVQYRKAVRDAIATGVPFTIAFVDLDGFRHVNEREGNQIGDEVLVEVASTLASVASCDLVARMSADEFGLIIHGTPLEAYAAAFNKPFHTGDRLGTRMLGIGASIGAARYPYDGDTAEALMRRADVALDVAKARGGSTTLVFDGRMEAILAESHLRVVELSNAIASDQLALVYQPTFDLATRRITGAEALVRWDHPVRGRLLPAEFIAFAENNGMIAELSRWVFRRTVRDVASIATPPSHFRVYFNLAAQMLDDIPFIAELRAALDADPRLVDHLGIEVTETAAMQNVERSMNTIDLFRGWGLTVAIDDFGTGYSSLSYLKQLSVDVIKIDRSFVMGLPQDERDQAITDMLLRITDRFGFATLAEGIETEEQLAWLLAHGCRYGQGYLIAKPFPFETLVERLETQYAA